jgi:hypothetical protein
MTRARTTLVALLGLAIVAAAVLLATRWPVGSRDEHATTSARDRGTEAANALPSPNAAGDGALAARPGMTAVNEREGSASPTVRVTGRVVDEHRRPVAGAKVTVPSWRPPDVTTTTDVEGRFAFADRSGGLFAGGTGERIAGAWGFVRVVSEAGGAAVVPFNGDPPEVRIGTIELAAVPPIRVRVVAASGPAADAAVIAWAAISGMAVVRVAEATTNASGDTALAGVPGDALEGDLLTILVVGHDGRRGHMKLPIESARSSVVIVSLGAERTFAVRVLDPDGKPVKGARVERSRGLGENGEDVAAALISTFPSIEPTDADGRTSIRSCYDGDRLVAAVTADGFAADEIEEVVGDTEFHDSPVYEAQVRLDRPTSRTITFPLILGELPIPPSGTVVEVKPWPGQIEPCLFARGRVDGSSLIAEDARESGNTMYLSPGSNGGPQADLDVACVAVALDGTLAELHVDRGASVGKPASFVRARRLVVTVTDETGHGVSGVPVVATDAERSRSQSRDHTIELSTPARRISDLQGRVEFSGLPARACDVEVGASVEHADLSTGDQSIEVHVGVERELEVHVLVDGKPGLPSGLSWDVPGALKGAQADEDPEHGILRVRARPRDPSVQGRIALSARRTKSAQADFEWPPLGTTAVVPLRLSYEANLVVSVSAAPRAPYTLRLEWRNELGSWGSGGVDDSAGDSAGSHTFHDLEDGTYRVVDRLTRIASEPVEVKSRAEPARVSLDLSAAIDVSGHVEIPIGYSLEQVRVVRDGIDDDPERGEGGARVDAADRSFHLRLPGGAPIGIHVRHPELVDAGVAGAGARVVVTASRDDIVLRLVEGPRAFVHVVAPSDAPPSEPEGVARLFRGEPDDWPDHESALAQTEEGQRFAGFEPGRYTVVLDVPPFAPKVLHSVVLGPEVTTLGNVQFERGSVVTIRVVDRDKDRVTYLAATAYGGLADRELADDGGARRFVGLSAGHYVLKFEWDHRGDDRQFAEKALDLDGHGDATIDLDVR